MLAMTDERFWTTIEQTWCHVEGVWDGMLARRYRESILRGDPTRLDEAFQRFWPSFARECRLTLSRTPLLAFIHLFRSKVEALDNPALAARIGLDDASFADARFFIVWMGRRYYEAVLKDPGAARPGMKVASIDAHLRGAYTDITGKYASPWRGNGSARRHVAGPAPTETVGPREDRVAATAEALWVLIVADVPGRTLDLSSVSGRELEVAVRRVNGRLVAARGAG